MSTVETKCSKKAGEYCRLHNPSSGNVVERMRMQMFFKNTREDWEADPGNAELKKKLDDITCSEEQRLINEQEAERARVEAEKNREKHDSMLKDMDKNMKQSIDYKTFTVSVSIFRSGPPAAPLKRGVENESYVYADKFAPEGRQGRMSGVFASPTMMGVTRWFRGNEGVNSPDYQVRELRVDPDTTYVYSVHEWERASAAMDMYSGSNPESVQRRETAMKKYWRSGVTLTEWYKRAGSSYMDPGEWELLLSADDIKTVKPVSGKRLIESATAVGWGDTVERIVKRDEKEKRREKRYQS